MRRSPADVAAIMLCGLILGLVAIVYVQAL